MQDVQQAWARTRVAGFTAIVAGLSLVIWAGAPQVSGQTYSSVDASSVARQGVGASGGGGSAPSALAFTGSNGTSILAVVGVAVLLAGLALLVIGRRRAHRTTEL